ncbi:MAG: hypothetical protein ACRDHG_13900 [Anaerolineales bacterium]
MTWLIPLALQLALILAAWWILPPYGRGGPDRAAEWAILVPVLLALSVVLWIVAVVMAF